MCFYYTRFILCILRSWWIIMESDIISIFRLFCFFRWQILGVRIGYKFWFFWWQILRVKIGYKFWFPDEKYWESGLGTNFGFSGDKYWESGLGTNFGFSDDKYWESGLGTNFEAHFLGCDVVYSKKSAEISKELSASIFKAEDELRK